MKKTTLRQAALKLAVVAIALFAPLGLRAQETVTIGTGTSTGYYPMPGFYGFQYDVYLYTPDASEELNESNCTISSIAYDLSSFSSYLGATIEIWLKDVDPTYTLATSTTFSQYIDGATKVVDEAFTTSATGWKTMNFTENFEHEAGMTLLVAVRGVGCSGNGGCSRSCRNTSVPGTHWYKRNDNTDPGQNASGGTDDKRSNIQLAIEPAATGGPTCKKVTGVGVTNITSTSATISWTNPVENEGATYYIKQGDNVITTTQGNSYTILGLTSSTTYSAGAFTIVSDCNNGAELKVANVPEFTTPCAGNTTFPWTETFNSLTAGIPNCWDNSEGTTSSASYKWNYYATGHDGAGLRFNSYSNSSGNTNFLKTPPMNFPAGQEMQLIFWYKNPTGGDFSVYISTDGGATYTTPLATGLTSQSTWKEKEINLTDYVGAENVVIVFKGTSNYGNGDAYIYLDDVTVRRAPSCLAPTGLAATPSTTSAELSWTANSSETAWTIYYKKATDENYTEVSNVTTNPYTLNDLTPASNYQFYVVANCSANDASYPSETTNFATECDVISAVGYSENFDATTASIASTPSAITLPNCWNFINTCTYSYFQYFPVVSSYSSSSNAHSGTNYLRFYSYGSSSSDPQPQYAILPEMSGLAGKFVTLWAKGYNYSSAYKIGTMTDPTDASTFTQIEEQALTTSYQEFEHTIPTDALGNYLAIMMDAASTINLGVYIDDIQITEVPTCRKPSALMLETPSAITAHTATLKWTNGEEGQNAWQIAYSTDADFDPDTVTPIDVTTNPDTLEGLAQSTTYYAYVRANCGNGDYSAWNTTRASFTTLAGSNAPTGLAVDDITVSSNSATATWIANAANDLHQLYELYLSTDATAPTAVSTPSYITNETSFTFTGLNPETEYFVWVRDNCGTDGISAWTSSVNFTTQAACPKPVLNAITEFTAHTANVTWSNFEENDSYVVSYRLAESINTNGGLYEDFNSLNTAYSIPEGWSNDDGTTSEASYKWCYTNATLSDGATNGTSHDGSNCVRFESYNNSSNKTNFLQTPSMDFPAGETMKLSFWWKNPAGGDFSVYISTDGGTTKNPIAEGLTGQSTWTQATYELTDYVGASNVTIHFKGTSNWGYGDAFIYLDDIMVGYTVPAGEWETEELTENSIELTGLVAETTYEVKVKGLCSGDQENESDIQTFRTTVACPVPTGLDTVGDATANSVDLTWTAGAANQDAWQICLNGDETNLRNVTDATVTGTTVTYTLTGLTSGADYSVKVRANCGGEDGVSLQWTNTVNFTTEASCTEPTAFAVVENSVEAHQAQLSWTAGGEEESWDIYYSEENTAPVNGVTEPTIEDVTENNPYTLTGLTDARTYYVWVRAHCGDAAGQQSPWFGPESFSTPQEAVPAPYADNFENGNNWLLVNGNLTNAWAYGEAVNNGGTHALYISNDGGTSNEYSHSDAMVYATKLFTFEEGTYKFSYDWKANGESTYDYLRVALGPATTTLTAGTSVPAGFSTTALPTGWTALDGGSKLNLVDDWQSYESEEMEISEGTYIMVFAWRNDYSGGDNPPAAIDNVRIEKITCIAPTALATRNFTAHAATLGWTAGADEEAWQIAYSTDANFTPDNDFTPDETTTWLVNANTNPFTINGLNANTPYRAYVRANCGTDDGVSNWSVLANFTTLAGNLAPTGLAVSGITSSTATATWTGVTTNELHESYDLYYSKLSSMPETLNEDSLFADITETSFEFTGLTPETGYHVWVRDNCGDDGYSAWSSKVDFATMATCSAEELEVSSIGYSNATLTWNGESNNGFTVNYREAAYDNVLFSEDFEDESTFADWTFISMNTANDIASGKAGRLSSEAAHSGSYGFRFSSFSQKANDETFDQYLISPELTEVGELKFYAKQRGSGDDIYYGYSTTTSDLDAFTWEETALALSTSWAEFTRELPSDVKYIAFHYYGNYKLYAYVDDITISTEVEAGEWNNISTNETSFELTGLYAGTKYDVKVFANCGEVETDEVSFTTNAITKPIEANKWYAISSPVHNSGDNETLAGVNKLTTGTYDLYGYTESAGTWNAPTILEQGKGYIYRRSRNTTLNFVGTPNNSVPAYQLSYECGDIDLKGFNLIGNPDTHAITVNDLHYTLNTNGTWQAHTSGTIGVAEAFLVQTNEGGSFDFPDQSATTGNTANSALAFTVSNEEYSDVAYAMLENGNGLRKIGHLNSEAPMLSIPVEGSRYAIANLGSDCQSFNLVFRGVNGTYTIKQSSNQAIAYCHLIDRVAGKDIDMLRQNYTFSSNGFDPDRFMVKLSPDAQENANGNFAYWNGNNWMVEGNGTLQVFDALGRQLFSQEISNSNFEIQNSLFPAAGVYVLRMGEKTQKIVVR